MAKVKTNTEKGILALVLLAFGFGGIAIAGRFLSGYFSLYQQLYLAVGIGFILSLFIFPRTLTIAKLRKVSWRDWGIMIFRVLVGFVIGASLYRASLTLTKISNVAFIQSIPFAAIFGFLLLKEKLSAAKILLLITAYGGVILIAVQDFSSILSFGKGELFSLISSALFSLGYVVRKWQSDILNDKEISQVLLFIGTVTLLALSWVNGETMSTVRWQGSLLIPLLFTGIFNVLNIFLINFGFRHVKAVTASNILTLEAIFALILAFIFYQELPTIKELLGGVIIIASVLGMNKLEAKT